MKKINRGQILKKYGLTLEQFDDMLMAQGGCAVCGSVRPGGTGWAVDHCHTSGHTRGILCHYCNLGLGMFRDNIDTLQAAQKYLLNQGYAKW